MWEGCRNYTVRNFFRDTMSIGDLAFFYNSNSDPSGICQPLASCGAMRGCSTFGCANKMLKLSHSIEFG